MIKIYAADNSLEAYMILNLLQQQEIEGRVEGEYLQGGIGELPPGGIVKVLVNDQDMEKARAVIEEWESKQPPVENNSEVPKRTKAVNYFFAGVLLGAGVVWWLK